MNTYTVDKILNNSSTLKIIKTMVEDQNNLYHVNEDKAYAINDQVWQEIGRLYNTMSWLERKDFDGWVK